MIGRKVNIVYDLCINKRVRSRRSPTVIFREENVARELNKEARGDLESRERWRRTVRRYLSSRVWGFGGMIHLADLQRFSQERKRRDANLLYRRIDKD